MIFRWLLINVIFSIFFINYSNAVYKFQAKHLPSSKLSKRKPEYTTYPTDAAYINNERNTKVKKNTTFVDVSDNSVHMPFQYNELEAKLARHMKKSPKRTIQKIIKKNKNYKKRLYAKMISSTTTITTSTKVANNEQSLNRKNKEVTTPAAHRRKNNKYKYNRWSRNPLPFHNLGQRRFKRKLEKDNAYILEDFDEIEFLSQDKEGIDADAFNVPVKHYW
ncbi:hypothetical protein JYU34_019250 [Plutella xylostella]|uniref:Uncharacterized protein n=1 Tax=Plutella xylostella TaxID=51655 RepID=A0ABQ7Q062_PLUXY|nr:hypothetical protein JYU34_019250 [Plutella xylostella]